MNMVGCGGSVRVGLIANALALGLVAAAASAETVDQDNRYRTSNFTSILLSDATVAQTFTAGLDGTLTRIELNMWASPDVSGNDVLLAIISTTDSEPDPVGTGAFFIQTIPLADLIKLDGNPLPTPLMSVDVSAQGLAMAAGTTYALVLGRDSDSIISPVRWSQGPEVAAGSDLYPAGTRWRSSDGGRKWIETLPRDFGFATFVTVPAGCNPADLSSPSEPGKPDGVLTGADFFEFLSLFEAGALSVDFSSPSDPGVPDGALTGADFFAFLDLFSQGC